MCKIKLIVCGGKRVNSEEIAKIARVSRSTVSRVINNYPNVLPQTREKIQKIIDEYGYSPNISARTLAGKANNIIGIFIADINRTMGDNTWIGINSPYNIELMAGVIASCKKRGYLTLVDTIENLDECKQMRHYFQNRMLFGGIFVGFPYRTKELERLADEHNIVLIDQLSFGDDEEGKYKIVNTNDIKGGYIATKYLIERGHTQIAHVSGDFRLSSLEREKGYLEALQEAGLKVKNDFVVKGHFREDVAYSETKALLEKARPTAIFVANDIMALGVARAILEKGLKIPDDISIIGFDNIKQAEWLNLELTTVSADLKEIAEESVKQLFENSTEKSHKICDVNVIERKTVKDFNANLASFS